jgi:hypothetical protein
MVRWSQLSCAIRSFRLTTPLATLQVLLCYYDSLPVGIPLWLRHLGELRMLTAPDWAISDASYAIAGSSIGKKPNHSLTAHG